MIPIRPTLRALISAARDLVFDRVVKGPSMPPGWRFEFSQHNDGELELLDSYDDLLGAMVLGGEWTVFDNTPDCVELATGDAMPMDVCKAMLLREVLAKHRPTPMDAIRARLREVYAERRRAEGDTTWAAEMGKDDTIQRPRAEEDGE